MRWPKWPDWPKWPEWPQKKSAPFRGFRTSDGQVRCDRPSPDATLGQVKDFAAIAAMCGSMYADKLQPEIRRLMIAYNVRWATATERGQ